MLKTVRGHYRNGRVELDEMPQGITEGQVFVTFLTAQETSSPERLMTFGMFSGPQQSTEADFKSAEFQGDAEDALDW